MKTTAELETLTERFKELFKAIFKKQVTNAIIPKLISGKTIDGETTLELMCPNCGATYVEGGIKNSYTLNSRHICPCCKYNPTRGGYVNGSNIDEFSVNEMHAAIDEPTEGVLYVATGNLSCNFNYGTSELTVNTEVISIAKLSLSKAELFDLRTLKKNGRYNPGHLTHLSGRYYYGGFHFAEAPETDATMSAWLTKNGVKTFYELNDCINAAKKASPAKVTPVLSIDERLLLPVDSEINEIENSMQMNAIILLKEDVDLVSGITTSYFACQRCGNMFVINSDKSGGRYCETECPHCGMKTNDVITPDSGYNRDCEKILHVVQDYDGKVLIRKFQVNMSVFLDPERNPVFDFSHEEGFRLLYDQNLKRFFLFEKNSSGNYEQQDSIRMFRGHTGADFVSVLAQKGSWLDYSGLHEYLIGSKGARGGRYYYWQRFSLDEVKRYLDTRVKYPVIEKLAKSGFAPLLKSMLPQALTSPEWDYVKSNFKSDNVKDALGMSVKFAKACELKDYRDLQEIRAFIEADNCITPDELKWFRSNNVPAYRLKEIREICPKITTSIAMQFLENVRTFQAYDPYGSSGDWIDYLKCATKIGMDMSDKHVLYPRSLKRDHDIVLKKVSLIKDKEIEEAFEDQTARAQRYYGYKTTYFEVRAPRNMEELFEEGRKLSHSVGSYADAISEGKMCIMFIRDLKKDPDAPYFTVEVDVGNARIAQMRSFSNRLIDMFDEDKLAEFVYEWAEKKKLDTSLILPKKKAS